VAAIPLTPEDRAASRVIETARADSGMSKAELARRARISLRTVNYYLDGERAMTLGAFRTLCAVLGVTREEAARRVAEALLTLDDTGD
jgi:ribosome-binding protein aMBF1 (putative translation factor)